MLESALINGECWAQVEADALQIVYAPSEVTESWVEISNKLREFEVYWLVTDNLTIDNMPARDMTYFTDDAAWKADIEEGLAFLGNNAPRWHLYVTQLNYEIGPYEPGEYRKPDHHCDDGKSAAAPGTTYSTGGPSAAAQYGIPNSTAEADNLELAVDWLMWMSAPQNFGPVANEKAGFLTTVVGTEASPVLQGFEAILALLDRLFTDPNGRLTAEHGDEWSKILQGYLLGETDDAATKQLLQDSWMKDALAVCENNGFDWCP